MAKIKFAQVTVIVFAQSCADNPRQEVTAEMCEAIAAVFTAGAAAIRERKHGTVDCWYEGYLLAQVSIDNGGKFDMDNGLPLLQRIEVAGR